MYARIAGGVNVIKFIKQLFCKHKHIKYITSYVIDESITRYVYYTLYRCEDCKKDLPQVTIFS